MILNLEVTGVSSSGIFSRGKIFTKGEYQKNSHGKYYPECSTRLVLDMTINIRGLVIPSFWIYSATKIITTGLDAIIMVPYIPLCLGLGWRYNYRGAYKFEIGI